jgi:hypothetical protein
MATAGRQSIGSLSVEVLILFWQQQRGRGAVSFRDDPQPLATNGVGRQNAIAVLDGVAVGLGIFGGDSAKVAVLMPVQEY